MGKWLEDKAENLEFDSEVRAINRIFDDYDKLKDKIKITGVYIDSRLETFSIGEMLNKDMAVIHIEKVNSDIRGLYPYIIRNF